MMHVCDAKRDNAMLSIPINPTEKITPSVDLVFLKRWRSISAVRLSSPSPYSTVVQDDILMAILATRLQLIDKAFKLRNELLELNFSVVGIG